MKISEVLSRTADIIEERGWGRGDLSFYGLDGICIMGAMYAATHDGATVPSTPHDPTEVGRAYHMLRESPAGRTLTRYLGEYPHRWNDHQAVDAAHVVDVLRMVAENEASRERETEIITRILATTAPVVTTEPASPVPDSETPRSRELVPV